MKKFYLLLTRLPILCALLYANNSFAQCGSNTQAGGTSGCGRSSVYSGQINPGNTVFNSVFPYSPGTYFQVPVLAGGCYTISTCGAGIDSHISCFQGNNTTGPYAWNDDNGPECTGTSASVTLSPGFTDYTRVDVRQYNCQSGGSSSITVRVRQNNNLTITSSNADMCVGQTRTLTATPTRIGTTPPAGAGDVGTFTGTGVSGTTFTAPTPGGASGTYTITYTFGYCSTTQNINVFRAPLGSISTPSQTICNNSIPLTAAATYGTGVWTASDAGVTFSPNNTTANATANNLPIGTTTLTWTVTNGPCTPATYSITINRVSGTGTWIGGTSNSWNNGANWCGGVPTTTTDVIIPDASSTAFDPHVDVTFAACRNITLNNGAIMQIYNGQALQVTGNWTNNSGSPTNVTASTSSTVNMTTMLSTIGGNTPTNFGNLSINGSSININQTTTVTNTLSMFGNLVLNSNLILGTSPGSAGTLTMGGVYMMTGPGYFRRYFNNTTNTAAQGLFPLGSDPGFYRRDATIQFTSAPGGGGYVEGRFVNTPLSMYAGLPIANDGGVTIQNYMNEGYWELNPGGGLTGGTYSLQLQYDGIGAINTPGNLRVIKSPGPAHSTWVADGSHGSVVGGTTAGYITRNGMSGFSWFVISSENANPLPIELVMFDATCEDGKVVLNWATASEKNNQYFSVERSADGLAWEEVGRVSGAGNSNTLLNYSETDAQPLNGLSYYRLKQTDYDGASETFAPANIQCITSEGNTMLLYPNPATQEVNIVVHLDKDYGAGSIRLSDMMGKTVQQMNVNLVKGENKFVSTDLNSLQGGTYLVTVTSDRLSIPVQKLIIRR